MKILKSFDDLYSFDIEQILRFNEVTKQLVFDLFIVQKEYLNEGFDDCAVFYVLECQEDYEELKKLQPHILSVPSEYDFECNEMSYAMKIVNDYHVGIIGKKEWLPIDEQD